VEKFSQQSSNNCYDGTVEKLLFWLNRKNLFLYKKEKYFMEWKDLFQIDREFNETELLLKNTVAKFVTNKIKPIIGHHFDNQTFPDEIVEDLGRLGVFGAFLPEELGGSNCSSIGYGLICQELERGDSGIRSLVSVQSSLVMYPIWRFGSVEQKQEWLPKLASGSVLGCFGLTEPDFGSNPAGMKTTAINNNGKIVVNGTKRWITNGDRADVCLIWAKDENNIIKGYLVKKGTKGLIQNEMKGKLSLRASHTGELILDNCIISIEDQLPHATGLSAPFTCLNSARFGIIWGAIGAAEDCFECALNYTASRKQFSKTLASYQLIQAKLVNMYTELTKAKLLALRIGQLKDSGKEHYSHISMGKMNNVATALNIARIARDILGANGITTDYSIMRHMLNLESVNTYEGTEDIHRLILGKFLTGINAFD
jgi:glutaryl-CoA dehydrogenase